MNFICYLFIVLLGMVSQSMAAVEMYTVLNIGGSLMKEVSGGSSYTNQNSFFVGHWGYGLGARAKVNVGQVGLGVVGELGWLGDSMDRKLNGAGNPSTYRNEFQRGLAGASIALNTGASAIFVEYYPWVQNSVIYSDKKSENPFRKNDKLKATGYGFGFNFGASNGMAYQLMYKKLQYRDVEMNGVATKLPTDQYEPLVIDEVSWGFVIRF